MDSHKRSTQLERLEVVETGRRRRWSDDEKLRIVTESFQAPRAISSTARRHGISRSLLMTWRRAFGPEPISPQGEQSGFARVKRAPSCLGILVWVEQHPGDAPMSTTSGATRLGQAAANRQVYYSPLDKYWHAFLEWRKRQRLRATLCDLSDRELMDIGTTRGEIDYAASNRSFDPRGIRSTPPMHV